MKIFKSVEQQLKAEKVNKLLELVQVKVEELIPDYVSYGGYFEAASAYVDQMLELEFSHPTTRFCCSYRVWKSVPKKGLENHWMYASCSSDDLYLQRPMDEEYGRQDYLNTGVSFIQENDIFGVVSRHDNLYKSPGLASIVYSEAQPDVPSSSNTGEVKHIDVESFVRSTMMIHPYYGSPSMHELFRLLLEWQWAYLEGGSQEPMAETSHLLLKDLGITIKSKSNLIDALMALPDQQVSQFYKTGDCTLNEECPELPLIFKFWCVAKRLIHVKDDQASVLSNLCFNYLNSI